MCMFLIYIFAPMYHFNEITAHSALSFWRGKLKIKNTEALNEKGTKADIVYDFKNVSVSLCASMFGLSLILTDW